MLPLLRVAKSNECALACRSRNAGKASGKWGFDHEPRFLVPAGPAPRFMVETPA